MVNKRYKYYQPNDKDLKDKYGDCVIRALTKVTDKTWLEVFDEVVPFAREHQCMPNSPICYEAYLKKNGFVYSGISNIKGIKRPKVESFAQEHPKGKYLLRVAHHVVALVDGIYYDTWDSGFCSMYGYWYKEE